MIKYWHKLPQSKIDELINSGTTIGFVLDHYKQPSWCGYPNALAGAAGCWSLNDNSKNGTRTEISRKFCKTCDCYEKEKNI